MKTTRVKIIYALLALAVVLGLLAALVYLRRRPADFLSSEADYYAADETAGHVHRPYARREYAWAEHEKGRIVFRTNNLGFREDEDTEVTKSERAVRVLVTGDSHTDGVVYNAESFPNLLERKLNSTPGAHRFEVINGGVGYYTFQNYAGFLQKYIYLKPDYFVVTVYLGNDFMEAVAAAAKRGQLSPPGTPLWHRLKLRLTPPPVVSQGLNQIVYFKTSPRMKDEALEIARRELQTINEICLQNGIRLRVLFLPTKWDVEEVGHTQQEKSRFDLTDAEANVHQALKESLTLWLERRNVKYLDLTAHMRGKNVSLFWDRDYHLNAKGHELVADVLYIHADWSEALSTSPNLSTINSERHDMRR